jgi:hypothetical protein
MHACRAGQTCSQEFPPRYFHNVGEEFATTVWQGGGQSHGELYFRGQRLKVWRVDWRDAATRM